jgi:Flp pilus assembly protein TadB
MPDGLGPVVIGPREIYDALLRMQGTVDRIADRQDTAQREADDRHRDVQCDLRDHEDRIRAGERLRWPLPALSAVLALVALVITVMPILTGHAPSPR